MIKILVILVILVTFLKLQSIVSSSNQTLLFSYSRFEGKSNNGNKYKHTINNLLTTFSSQATITNTGFYNSTFLSPSTNNNNIYGLFLCRGDLDRHSCRACVNYAKHNILSNRYNNYGHEAMFWYDYCMIRYSNQPITGILNVNTSTFATWDDSNKVTSNLTRFTHILRNAMNILSVQAANGQSGKKFATRIVKVTEDESLYALAQCTPDLTVNDCHKCLRNTIEKLTRMGGSKSGKVHQLNCMIRYEMYPFFYTNKIKHFQSAVVNQTEIRLRVRLEPSNIEFVNSTSSLPSSVTTNTPATTVLKGNETGVKSE